MKTVEVQIRDYGDIRIFDAGHSDFSFRDFCILKSDYGMDYGKVVSGPNGFHGVAPSLERAKLLRKATSLDLSQIEENRRLAKAALSPCREKVSEHGLPMRVLASEYSFDRHKVVFYFTAAGRVDFRALVRDLAAVFKARIDLRQIGPRNEARIIGGIAPCGKMKTCCTQFMKSFATITTRMAKIQRLPVHQEKLLGLCGQLKCCLKFELDHYEEFSRAMPPEGSDVLTKMGRARVVAQDILSQSVTVRLADDRQVRCPVGELRMLR